jgi:hypothetical protein
VTELPVTVDWFGGRHGVRWTRAQLGGQLAARLEGPDPVGVMLHHAVTDDRELALVEEMLALFVGHPATELTTMATLASPSSPGPSCALSA